jgi:prepilin-type N-terminal cleavage/methylation domain-containing protein
MVRKMCTLRSKLHDEKGFTLIEMAIVLVIIGIIIGAVVKGKDVMKSAEQKRLYTTFIRDWQMAYNNYYDRTGGILGDANNATNTGGNRNGRAGVPTLVTAANLNSQLGNAGLTPPAVGSTGATNVRTYTDAWGRQYVLTLQFSNNATFGNYIQITSPTGIPYDLGIAWDRIVDGAAAGNTGDFLYIPNIGSPAVATAWPGTITGTPPATSALILRLEF